MALVLATAAVAVAAGIAAAPPPRPATCDLETVSLAGEWKDPRHGATTWVLTEDRHTLQFSVKGPWPGQPAGQLYKNGSLTLVFSPSNTATGYVTSGCDIVIFTDGPDKRAGNTWCKLGSKCDHAPPPPPKPPMISYPSLSGGAFSGSPAPSSPDPLASYRWEAATIQAQQFQEYRREPLKLLASEPVPSSFSGASTLLQGSAGAGAMVVSGPGSVGFDFGSECAGWLEFDSADLDLASVAVSLSSSEFTLPQFTTPTGENNHGNCTLPARAVTGIPGRYQLAINTQLYEGLRYAWLHVQAVSGNPPIKFTVTNVTAVCQVIPMNYADHAFEADGPAPAEGAEPGAGSTALEEVWYTSVYTTRVATIRYAGSAGFGSILMDRGDRISWTGDAHLAQKAALASFGGGFGSEMVRANTERTKKVDNGIISYDMYFILSAVDYFMHTADASSLSSWAPLIEAKFATSVAFFAKPKQQGFCGSDDRIGADFEHSPPSEAEKTRYYKQLSIQAARAYARAVSLCNACNASVHAGAAKLGALLSSKFEAERGWLTTPCTGGFTECYGMHAATNAVLTGMTTPAEEQRIYETLLSNPAHVCSFSPFNSYFILEAMSRLRLQGGRNAAMRAALAMVRRCFHGMTRLGATTYWETYSPEWNRLFAVGAPTPNSQTGYMSHCHPWASGAAPWLTQHVLGLRPQTPGWRTFNVVPYLDPSRPSLLSSIRGVQTLESEDEIRVSFACNGSSSLTVPTNTMASLVALPLCGAKAASLHVDGQVSSLEHSGQDSLLVHNLTAGTHDFMITFAAAEAGAAPPPVVRPDDAPGARVYRDRFIAVDHITAGDWRSKYGADGHVLWSWKTAGVDEQKLPATVSGIKTNTPFTGVSGKAARPNYAKCSTDRRALEPLFASSNSSCRALGALVGGTVATVDISGSGMHNVSLYLVDWERQGRQVAVELREYENLQLAAPTQYVSNFTEGVWMTWETKLPARLRLFQVAGPLPNNNALLVFSALTFDNGEVK